MTKSNGEVRRDEAADPILSRLRTLEEELRRLTELASKEEDVERRQQYWDLARDLQSEVREVRMVLKRMPPPRDEDQIDLILRRALKSLGMSMDAAPVRT